MISKIIYLNVDIKTIYMKRCMLVLTVLLATTLAWLNAQEHLMFMKIPINGTLTIFVEKMKGVGFELVGKEGNNAVMSGSFMGRDCLITIGSTTKSSSVYAVNILFAREYAAGEWYAIKGDYQRIVSAYREKYGEPTDGLEMFQYPYEEWDGFEIEALYQRKCWYVSRWKNPEGTIRVAMVNNRICIYYEDRENALLEDKEYTNQVNGDI